MSQIGPSGSPKYEAVILTYKHSSGAEGELVPDRDGVLVLAGVARRLAGNIRLGVSSENNS